LHVPFILDFYIPSRLLAWGFSFLYWQSRDEGHITRAPNVANIREYILRVDEMIRRKKDLFLQATDPEK
jgi:hypothetical protein